ncbi:MAG: TonB-dependent receptor [Steroidobacteraceae bacterium]
MNISRYTLCAALGATLAAPLTAAAQESDNQIETVVVTAQKRAQDFNDVSISVSVLTGDDVKGMGLAQMKDIATQTPNVRINETLANSIPNVSIRGIGLNDYAANNNPAAGIYVDEVYLVSPAMLTFQLFDVERVEVLKGPQGTLFGRNTTAGTVNFVSRKPTDQFEASASLDYGRYDYGRAEGAISGPLGDKLSARLAVQTTQQDDGYQTNRLTGKHVGDIDRTSWRGLLQWQPTDSLDVLLNVHGGRDRSDVSLVKIDNPFSTEDDGDTDPYRSGASVDPRMDLELKGAALTANWSISDALTFTSVTGYDEFKRLHVEDRDATSLIQLDGTFRNRIEQFSQEARLTYVGTELVLTGGAFYGTDTVDTRDRFDASDLLPLLGLAGVDAIGNEYSQETRSTALFLNSEWRFNPAWRLNAGARYTNEKKEFSNAFTYLIAGGAELQVFPPVANDYDIEDVSGKIGLDYTGFADTLLYASLSRGFKSGGFQGQLTFNPADLQAFDDESLLAYELGAKKRLLDGRMQLNASVFYYDYSDMQFYGGLFDSPLGTLFGITNVGDAEILGGEFDLWWKPTAGLDVRLGVGLLDTKITKSVVAGVAEGSKLPNSPDFTLNGLVRYQWPIAAGLRADVTLSGNYQDDLSFDIVRDPPQAHERGYFLADARIGIGADDDRWNAYLWAKNLADERYRTQVLFSSVGYGATYGPPRTYGVGVSVSFK